MEINSVTTFAKSGKVCFLSSITKWVIDFGSTNRMTDNPISFFVLWPHRTVFSETIADGSTYEILRLGTAKLTSSLALSSVLHLPKLAFNMIYVSKLTRDLNCCVTLFLDHCIVQDIVTKHTIGKGTICERHYWERHYWNLYLWYGASQTHYLR